MLAEKLKCARPGNSAGSGKGPVLMDTQNWGHVAQKRMRHWDCTQGRILLHLVSQALGTDPSSVSQTKKRLSLSAGFKVGAASPGPALTAPARCTESFRSKWGQRTLVRRYVQGVRPGHGGV